MADLSINYVLVNNKVRMLALKDNVVFEADLSTDVCNVIGFYDAVSCSSYCYACQVGDYLLAAPSAINDFLIMDRNYEWTRIPVEDQNGLFPIKTDLQTWTVFGIDHHAWKIGFTYPAIIKVDVETGEVEYITNWLKDVEGRTGDAKENAYFGNGYVIDGEKLILPLFCCPGLLEMNLNTYEYEIHMVDSKYKGFRTLSGDEELWLETIQGSVICVTKDWKVKVEITNLEFRTFGPFAGGYWRPVLTDKKVFLFPYYSTGIYEIDRNSYEVTYSELNKKITGNENDVQMTSEVNMYKNRLYFFAEYNEQNGFFIYDLDSEKLEKHEFVIDSKGSAIIYRERMRPCTILKESDMFQLSSYLQALSVM